MVFLLIFQLVACNKNEDPAITQTGSETLNKETNNLDPNENNDGSGPTGSASESAPLTAYLNIEQMDKNNDLFKDYKAKEIEAKWSFPDIHALGDWGSTPAPELSPFGPMANYATVDYTARGSYAFEYIDDQQMVIERMLYGELWEATIPYNEDFSEEENFQLATDYKNFIEPLGGKSFGMYRDETTYYYEGDSHNWVAIKYNNYDCTIYMMKERRINLNETIVVNTSDYDDKEAHFTVEIPDDYFISLLSSIDSGHGYITIDMETVYGDYQRFTDITTDLNAEEGLEFVDDDYINEPGLAHINVHWQGSHTPNTIKFTLEAKYKVDPIEYGEQLGGITLSSDHVRSVTIKPTLADDLRIKHPDYEEEALYFDKNQEGDFITYVPAGYYEIQVMTDGGMVDQFKTLKVPVHSGKMTKVIVPQAVTDVIKNANATEEKGVFISDVNEQDQLVSFVFSLVDNATKDVLPDKDHSTIFEGGAECDIVSIEPVITPLNIVVLLDSSGSMKGQMDQTIKAAKTFIKGLPENTHLTFVDFDTTPKPLKGTTIDGLISELDTVKADGATALYDAVILGLTELKGKERPALLVFTDGEDANYNDTARGSTATLEEALSQIDASSVPLYTIGFGEGHDSTTLELFAQKSLGKYYPADDQSALTAVFDAINEKLGNTYIATYKRPSLSSVSDVPVVSFVIDVSTSMYSDFYTTSGFRLDDVKVLYHDFLQDLPEETQIIVTAFNDEIQMTQGITTEKVLALNAIGNLKAKGGTDILGSVAYGYEALKKVASSKKIMIYLTDAALEVDKEQIDDFQKTLTQIKDDNIQTLWVGMGIDDDTAFQEVAALSGGDYIVSEDHKTLTDKFNVILDKAKTAKASDKTAITLNIKKSTDEGAFERFSSSVLYPLSPVKHSDELVIQDTIQYQLSDIKNVKQYDAVTSQYISGDSMPAESTIITKRIKTDAVGENDAASIQVDEIMFLNKLSGVDAPKGQRFMAVLMEMTHILPKQEVIVYPDGSGHPSSWATGNNQGVKQMAQVPYSIPNFINHFGMSYNGVGPYPSATATWLTYEPIVVPGTYDITLTPNEAKKGMMVFLVPDLPLEQLGLHFYDDNYGFIDLPIVGVLPEIRTTFGANASAQTKLSDNFSLDVTGYGTEDVLAQPIDQSQHRLVEGAFVSDVKAVINVKPSEAMYMKLPTSNGDFYSHLSTTTSSTPFGFYFPQAISPGANNPVRMLFQMPTALEQNKAELFLDLKDVDMNVQIKDGETFDTGRIATFKTAYFSADINDVYTYSGKLAGSNKTWIIADVTIHDTQDGYATRGASNNFNCNYDADDQAPAKEVIKPTSLSGFASSNTYGYGSELRSLYRLDKAVGLSSTTSELLLGLDKDAIIYDGTSRRGFMVFSIASADLDKPWMLQFDETDLNIPVQSASKVAYEPLLIEKEAIKVDTRYNDALTVALDKAIEQYKLRYPEAKRTKVVSDAPFDEVVMPSANTYGYKFVEQIKTIDDLKSTLNALRFINPGASKLFKYTLSKEALLTQGFGTEADMANLTIQVLSRLGYKPKLTQVSVTDAGKTLLSAMSGTSAHQIHWLPAVTYFDDKGLQHMMVLPFAKDLKALEGLVFYEGYTDTDYDSQSVGLNIYYDVLPTEEGHLAQINSMAGALGGGSSEVAVTRKYLSTLYIPLATFSKDAVDIGTAIVGNKAYPIIYTADGPIMSEDSIDLNYYGIKGTGFKLDGLEHHAVVTEDMEVNQIFMSVAYNLPEIPMAAGEMISAQMASSQGLQADTLSSLKWLHRKALYNFITSQTAFERGLDRDYNLITGRIKYPRLLVVQSSIDDTFTMSMDLLRIQNELHTGEKDLQNSYRLMSGISASQLESKALENGKGMEDVWALMPSDATLVLFSTNQLDLHRDLMVDAGMTDEMIDYFDDMNKMVIIQSAPSIIDGKERWAWLEIDRGTYETIAVLDTFEHGAMSSNATLNSTLEKGQYIIGAFKGIETSVWAVASMSLELTSYEAILENAKSFALQIGNNFEVDIGPFNLAAGKAPELGGNAKKLQDFFKGGEKEEDSKGFKEGYKDGVELYFKLAK